MAVGFDAAVTFQVRPDDEARLPMPVPADDGTYETWSASIILATRSDYDDLKAYKSYYTVLPAMGGGGLVITTAGRGRRTLVIPTEDGNEAGYYAILSQISANLRMLSDEGHTADVEFLILGAVS